MRRRSEILAAKGICVAAVAAALLLAGGVPQADAIPVRGLKVTDRSAPVIRAQFVLVNPRTAKYCYANVRSALFTRTNGRFRVVRSLGNNRLVFRPCGSGVDVKGWNLRYRVAGVRPGKYWLAIRAVGILRGGQRSARTRVVAFRLR